MPFLMLAEHPIREEMIHLWNQPHSIGYSSLHPSMGMLLPFLQVPVLSREVNGFWIDPLFTFTIFRGLEIDIFEFNGGGKIDCTRACSL
jgi:hypothetical protein